MEIARGRLLDMAPFAAARDLSPLGFGAGTASALRTERDRLVLKACVAAEFPCDKSLFGSAEARLAWKACVAAELPQFPSEVLVLLGLVFVGLVGRFRAVDAEPTASRAAFRPAESEPGSHAGAIL